MNTVERVLADDMARLLDRLASSLPDGAVNGVRTGAPKLRSRLDEMETQLAAARAALLEDYGRWLRALDDVENLWALATFRSLAERSDTERPQRLAA